MYIAVEIYANKKCEFMLYNKSLAGKKLREFAKYGGPLRIHRKMEGGNVLHSYFHANEDHIYILRNFHIDPSPAYRTQVLDDYKKYELLTKG